MVLNVLYFTQILIFIQIYLVILSGSSFLKNFSWPLKSKKRHRSGSGGSKDFEVKKKNISMTQQKKLAGKEQDANRETMENKIIS